MSERETVEILQLIAETRKFMAEQHKLLAEASKFRVERWLAPFVAIFAGLGAFTASWAVVRALLHTLQ